MKWVILRLSLPAALCLLLSFSLRCGPTGPSGLTPVSAPDAAAGCPGGRTAWKLEILDRRAERRASDKVTALVADSIRKSFPACTWDNAGPNTPTITVELDTFSSTYFSESGGSWEAEAVWLVSAREPSGHVLTEFECDVKDSRPNYAYSNNEKELLTRVFGVAMDRVLGGLRAIPAL